jgi:NADH-quinone oxidoreductase subunit F
MATQLTPILTKFWDHPQSWTLETYEATTATRRSEQGAVDGPGRARSPVTKDSSCAVVEAPASRPA